MTGCSSLNHSAHGIRELSGTGEMEREASGEVDVCSKRLDLISPVRTK
jgi:hypothetical protein